MPKLILGRHVNTSYGFTTAPGYAATLGCNIFQIFLGPPAQISYKAKTTKDLDTFRLELNKHKLQVVVHGSYTINLCHPENSPKFKSSMKLLKQDLDATHILGARCLGVIIHMGKNIKNNKISNSAAIKNYVHGIKNTIKNTPTDTTIILETGASQGTEVASRISGLGKIYHSLTPREQARVKFCIDTCHIWSTGYDISTSTGVAHYFDKFDQTIGLSQIACIHFNDSKGGLNSHVDRHADIGEGTIKETGLKAACLFAYKHDIPIIMETPLETLNPQTNTFMTFIDERARIQKWITKSKKTKSKPKTHITNKSGSKTQNPKHTKFSKKAKQS